jgi:preprotein translocase subunit Sec63
MRTLEAILGWLVIITLVLAVGSCVVGLPEREKEEKLWDDSTIVGICKSSGRYVYRRPDGVLHIWMRQRVESPEVC